MAKEVVTRVWDDLDTTQKAEYEDLPLGLDGQIYMLDLSESSYLRLIEALKPFTEAAHDVIKWPKSTQPKKAATKTSAPKAETPAAHQLSREERPKARKWGRANGFEVATSGPLPSELVEAFIAANHPKGKRG